MLQVIIQVLVYSYDLFVTSDFFCSKKTVSKGAVMFVLFKWIISQRNKSMMTLKKL